MTTSSYIVYDYTTSRHMDLLSMYLHTVYTEHTHFYTEYIHFYIIYLFISIATKM